MTDPAPIVFDARRAKDATDPEDDTPVKEPTPEPIDLSPAPGGREPYDPDAEQKETDDQDKAIRASAGPSSPPGEVRAPEWSSPIDAFLSAEAHELPTKVFRIERANGFRVDITLTAIPTPRYNKLVQQFTTWSRDKQTGERVQQTKDRELKAQLIIEAARDIDFNDKRLWEQYGGQDPHHLVERMFLRGEIERMAGAVAALAGFVLDDLEEDAGKS